MSSLFPALAPAEELLPVLLDLSLAGLACYTPIADSAGRVTDFAFAYLNPTAQRLLGLPAQPSATYAQQFPASRHDGSLEFLRGVFSSGQPGQAELSYPPARLQAAARRHEDQLLVSFTELAALPAAAGPAQPAQLAAALQETQHRYRQLADSLASGYCVLEVLLSADSQPTDYRFLELNSAFEQLTGLVNALGRTIRELAPINEQHWLDYYGRVALTGEPVRFEASAAQLDRAYEVYAYRVGPPDARQVAVLFSDISTHKQAEERARRREENQRFLLRLSDQLRPLASAADIQYRAVCTLGEHLGASRVGYAENQPDGQTIVVTRNYTCGVPSLEGRYHYDDYGPELLREFWKGHTVVRPDIAHDPTLTAAEKAAHAALQLGATVNVPLLKDGQLVAVLFMHHTQAHPWTGDELALLTEVGERTWAAVERARAEAALYQSEKRLQKALSIGTVGVIFFDLAGGIHDANKAFQRMSGFSRPDLVSGRVRWDQLTPPEFMAATLKSRDEFLTKGRNTPYEKQYIRPDGSRWWGLFAGKRLSEHECVEFVLDITASKLAQQQLRDSNEQLRRTNADLDTFIYAASHDLKAPIANIEGLLQALRHELPAASQVDEVPLMLDMMQDAVERFGRTIGHLTDISRLQKAHHQPAAPVSLARVVREVQLDLAPLVAQAEGKLAVAIDENATLAFSEKNLRSVVYNLLSNAFKYRHPERPPRVCLSYQPLADYHLLTVQDNGLGLDLAHDQAKLFGMFQRLHTHVEGSGVGLYMVRRMVENAGGRIEVASELGHGSTFRVYFPKQA